MVIYYSLALFFRHKPHHVEVPGNTEHQLKLCMECCIEQKRTIAMLPVCSRLLGYRLKLRKNLSSLAQSLKQPQNKLQQKGLRRHDRSLPANCQVKTSKGSLQIIALPLTQAVFVKRTLLQNPQVKQRNVVFSDNLDQLHKFCNRCGSPMVDMAKFATGSMVSYKITCHQGHS